MDEIKKRLSAIEYKLDLLIKALSDDEDEPEVLMTMDGDIYLNRDQSQTL